MTSLCFVYYETSSFSSSLLRRNKVRRGMSDSLDEEPSTPPHPPFLPIPHLIMVGLNHSMDVPLSATNQMHKVCECLSERFAKSQSMCLGLSGAEFHTVQRLLVENNVRSSSVYSHEPCFLPL